MSKPWILLCPSSRGIAALLKDLFPYPQQSAPLTDSSSGLSSASDRDRASAAALAASATGPGVAASSKFSDSSSSDTYPYPSPAEFSAAEDSETSTTETPGSSASSDSSGTSRSGSGSPHDDPLNSSSSSSSSSQNHEFQSQNHQSQSQQSSQSSQPSPNSISEAFSSRLHLLPLDVCHEDSIFSAAQFASSLFPTDTHHLHLAFALPGILHPEKSPQQVDYDLALDTYRVNCLGPLMLMKHFGNFLPRRGTKMDLAWHPIGLASNSSSGLNEELQGHHPQHRMKLPPHATWINMSARVGSVSDNKSGGWYSYRSSKAAVNSLTKSFDHQLQSRSGKKAMCVGYHPGTVRTDLSRDFWGSVANDKIWGPEEAVVKMAGVIEALGEGQRGRIWDWKGEEVLP
ncbi:hypothetical protein SMACR_05203 [Sordaria macrospora]|uniref:WGS project CABT00000000 data, contig 2.8 n=2 Tax=Sordaria macrospora TaxID=5147 RepID=F7VV34_SORMK|nr:uncharacterized protein SMAC_05203 [Sordaria macrospora k-hell]KAA8632404.1 hypothetical protein SMACR_05203 [Sordaria macrospora]WPJ57320.1 hypothetical protein SMAC4_05203 [Sordaria macrospora]CCC09381.1 unnamed protein product [Sordaria macrospora k-hell]